MNKHTPGPWRCNGWGEHGTITIGAAAWCSKDHSGKLARLDCPRTTEADESIGVCAADVGQCEANARLIAAAPDLLLAARYTLENMDAAANDKLIAVPRWFQAQLGESTKMLRAAIAKAEEAE